MCRRLILLLTLALTLRGWGAKEIVVENPIGDIAQDGAGGVWGICREQAEKPLVHLEGREWMGEAIEALGEMLPVRLIPRPDGSMACLWSKDDAKWAVSFHRGDEPPRVVHFEVSLTEVQVLARSDGSLLITESGATIVEITEKKDANVVLIPDEFFRKKVVKDEEDADAFAPICAVEDAEHHVWLWSYALDADPKNSQLLNFMGLEKGKLTKRKVPGLDPAASISAVAPVDAGHLWFAKVGAGIYSLDLKTMKSELITHPLPKGNGTDNVEYIEQIFLAGQDRFALTSPRPTIKRTPPIPDINNQMWLYYDWFYEVNEPCGRLLRYRDGQWDEILSGIDWKPRFGWRDRPCLMTSAGLLLATNQGGPWLALRPEGKPPVHLGWQTDFPLLDATRLLPAGDHQVRILSSKGETELAPIEPARDPNQPHQARELVLMETPQTDGQGNCWTFRNLRTLSKWNGEKWIDVAIPKEVATTYDRYLWWVDDRDQGWYLCDEGKAAICDLTTSTWKVYPNWEQAATAQLPRGARVADPEEPHGLPVFSEQGQVAYLKMGDGVHYFDGKAWRNWTLREIAGDAVSVNGPLFFNERHQLSVPLDDSVYERNPILDQWDQRDGDTDDKIPKSKEVGELPEGCPLENHLSAIKDDLDRTWIISAEKRLFKSIPGRTVPALVEDEANPFRYGRALENVLIDPLGGAFIELADQDKEANESNITQLFHLPAKLPLPQAKAELVEAAAGHARVRLSADEPATEIWYSWQLDDGPWHAVQQEKEITLNELTGGKHHLQVRAYNAELGTAREPASLELQLDAANIRPLKAWIADLGEATREKREAAAKYLRAQGASALPPLREAQKSGAAEAKWWVDKIIGEIEGDLKPAARSVKSAGERK